ncbi:MAG: hypothetical protein PUJ51_14420 [Clostridiales bacterium]|uniref:hypothetical protein n=1 Tax=Terrisporobacter sp. TaxID=1965305 RepID=UPI002A57E5AA|nr:hypothetical protein [Terrisporobacter sp.]MDD7755680.1 hypothetical protein [Clostridiales bacterium]MDY4135189.1 hypothetical protein [Terrisporobacter sp.]
MNEIYWITRLTCICNFLTAVAVVSFLISAFIVVFVVCNRIEANNYEKGGENWNYYMQRFKMFLSYFKRLIFVAIIACLINFFIPTTNEALMIYGVGGTIDYVKSNETAKQLPDKYVKALDKWVENLTKEENQKQNDNESK